MASHRRGRSMMLTERQVDGIFTARPRFQSFAATPRPSQPQPAKLAYSPEALPHPGDGEGLIFLESLDELQQERTQDARTRARPGSSRLKRLIPSSSRSV